MTEHTIGVDISKSYLDVFDLEAGVAAQFGNSAAGLKALRQWLREREIARIVYEPTGAYHKAFEIALESGYPLVKVNPLQARRFAEACGTRAKTDRSDARSLARMGRAFALEPQPPKSGAGRILRESCRRHEQP